VWCKTIVGRFFGLVTKHACDRRTDIRTDRITTPKIDRTSIAASRGKNDSPYAISSRRQNTDIWYQEVLYHD